MATLGNQTTGFGFSVSGSYGDAAGGPYTVPSPGISINAIHAYVGNNGSSSTGRLYVWEDASGKAGGWLARSGGFPLGGLGWQARTDISTNSSRVTGGIIPAGTVIWIGFYSSSGIENFQGASTGTTDLGNTADGDFAYHGVAGGGMGVLAAYIDYTAASGGGGSTGSIWYGNGSGVANPVAIWYGDASGVPHQIVAVYVGTSLKKDW